MMHATHRMLSSTSIRQMCKEHSMQMAMGCSLENGKFAGDFLSLSYSSNLVLRPIHNKCRGSVGSSSYDSALHYIM